jgi:hypothetical protein
VNMKEGWIRGKAVRCMPFLCCMHVVVVAVVKTFEVQK